MAQNGKHRFSDKEVFAWLKKPGRAKVALKYGLLDIQLAPTERALSALKTCADCEDPFLAVNPSRKLCDHCREKAWKRKSWRINRSKRCAPLDAPRYQYGKT